MMSEEYVHLLRKIQKCLSANDRNEIVIVFLKLGECVRVELACKLCVISHSWIARPRLLSLVSVPPTRDTSGGGEDEA